MFTTSFQTWQEHLLHSNVQQQKDKNNVLQTAAVQSIVVMTLYFDIFRSIFNSRPFLGWYRNCSTSPKKKTFIEIYYNSALFGLAGIQYMYGNIVTLSKKQTHQNIRSLLLIAFRLVFGQMWDGSSTSSVSWQIGWVEYPSTRCTQVM